MTKSNTTAAATFNATDVREAVLFLTNDADFYGQTRDLRANLAGHLLKGKWDADKARKILGVFVSTAQKSHSWGVTYGTWKLAKADRDQVARELLEHYADELEFAAAEAMGPEYISVKIFDFDHDSYGNPTAKHVVFTSTEDGGCVKKLSANWNPRRDQVGYSDNTDGAASALKKAGYKSEHYERFSLIGERSSDLIEVAYKRADAPKVTF